MASVGMPHTSITPRQGRDHSSAATSHPLPIYLHLEAQDIERIGGVPQGTETEHLS